MWECIATSLDTLQTRANFENQALSWLQIHLADYSTYKQYKNLISEFVLHRT